MYLNTFHININTDSVLNTSPSDFNVKKYTFNNNEYKILKYNRDKLKEYEKNGNTDAFDALSKFRSVIVRNNKVMCYSPAKSIEYSNFKKKYENHTDCWIEDFIDGTMINLFFDVVNDCWELATRSTVGGNIIFFNDVKNYKYFDDGKNFQNYYNATFRTLFFECCNVNNFNLNTLDKRYTYTFVMQHPFNRIVTPITMPMLYLVKVYEINNPKNNDTTVEIKELNLLNFVSSPPFIFMNTNVKFINKYTISSYKDIENYYSAIMPNMQTPYSCVGCMLYSSDGTRSKIRNSNYEAVRKLRGNQPKLQYHYLSLKKENKVKEFLHFYPEHFIIFNKFKLMVYAYTNELFINYISCFIRKEKPLKEYDFQYKNHMFKLHEKFKTELKPVKKTIDKKFVIDYVNSLHPAQQMFVINYKPENFSISNSDNCEDVDLNVEEINATIDTKNNTNMQENADTNFDMEIELVE